MSAATLRVSQLTIKIDGIERVQQVSFSVEPGERLGVIGGSGSGKTLTARAIAGLLPTSAELEGSITLHGTELVGRSDRELAAIRGDQIGMVFQEPKTALNPLRQLGQQMTESLALHYSLSRAQRHRAALRLAQQVGLPSPERMLRAYPHELSGGQRQRAAIAAAICAQPSLLLADEPTTALDVTVQRDMLRLFRSLSDSHQISLIFITHDLALLAEVVDRVLVFDQGRVVETGTVAALIQAPKHPVTQALVHAANM